MSKLTLNSVEWEKFRVRDIFEVINSKAYHKENLNFFNKGIEYITRTSLNNGVEGVVLKGEYKLNSKNSISLGAENADFFFHENEYITGNKMYCIRNMNINKYTGIFLVNIFRNSIKNAGFGFGKGLTGTRFKNRFIKLPIDNNRKPNWKFMEDYIKQEMKEQSQKIVNYYENKVLKLSFELLDLEVEWKEFFFTDIFKEIKRGKRLTKANQIEGNTPYISSTASNNGVDNFISNDKNVRKYKNNLSIANSGSVGSCFYHKYEYIASDHITALSCKNADENIYKFMSTIIKRLKNKYSFNREINDTRISREKLILPIDKDGNPNWEYMSKFIKKIENEKINSIINYLSDIYIYIINKINDIYINKFLLKNVKWHEYFIEDICKIKSGKDIYERERINGKIPYITSTSINNGIGYFINNINSTLEKECISVNRNGSVGYSFYHPYTALFGNDTRKLILKNNNKYIGLFVSFMISKQKIKYGYGYKMGTKRLKRQKILLPVKKNNVVDFEFIKNYMIIKELENIKNILNFYKLQH